MNLNAFINPENHRYIEQLLIEDLPYSILHQN